MALLPEFIRNNAGVVRSIDVFQVSRHISRRLANPPQVNNLPHRKETAVSYETGVGYLTKTHFREAGEVQTALPAWLIAVRAAESKKATDLKVLDLTGVTSFADYFVICTGSNPKQVQAITDEIGLQLKQVGELPNSMEGYNQAEWVLVDYGDLLIHVFSTKAREYYGLERLWRNARTVEIPPE
jgi:ribosome-associated protein